MIDVNMIMSQTSNGLDVFYRLIPAMPPQPNKNKLFMSVFREERTASANVFRKTKGNNKGIWHYKDLGSDDSLDAIGFIMKMFAVDFKTACNFALDSSVMGRTDYQLEPMLPEKVVLPQKGLVDRILRDQSSNLHKALGFIPAEHFTKWGIGTWVMTDATYTAFVFQNREGAPINIKWCEYQENGKRRKLVSPKSYKAQKKGDFIEVYEFCLFGEHLLAEGPLCIVESEKTALIASYAYPQFSWLATHGQSKFTEEDAIRTGITDGREIIVLCDADKKRKTPAAYTILKKLGANVALLDLFPDRADSEDLADYIIEGLRPEIVFSTSLPAWAQVVERAKTPEAEAGSMDVTPAIEDSGKIVKFWKTEKDIEIVPSLYMAFLAQEKFRKIRTPDGQAQYIHIDGKFIDESDLLEIKDYVKDYVEFGGFGTRPLDYIIDNPRLFRNEYLTSLTTVTPKIQSDTLYDSYVYYQNCVVNVNKSGVHVLPYEELDGLVWRSHIVKRNYTPTVWTGCVFDRFVRLITGGNPIAYDSMRTIIGYMLHTHKNSATNRVVIFNDEVISEKSKGGSGKGMVCDAISQIRETVMIDGKTHDMKASFPFQLIKKSTQFVMFDDVDKTFNFSSLFSVVTGGMTIEYKNKGAFRMTVEESPNIAICTNFAISGDDDSNNRRRIEVELSNHFTEFHTPLQEFGHFLFIEWDETEWAKFDSFMMDCLRLYFEKGCMPYPFKNLDYKKFVRETSTEFMEFIEDHPFVPNKTYRTSEVLAEFLKEYPDQAKFMNIKRMTIWMEAHAPKIGCKLGHAKNAGVRYRIFTPVASSEAVEISKIPFEPTIESDPDKPPF